MTLSLTDISLFFGDLHVLDGVSLTVAAGEVHALLGENGAGKTTLMRVAYGLLRAESGEVTVSGAGSERKFSRGFDSPAAARSVGIGMVHQHFTSILPFTVAENIALAGGWRETGAAAEARARALIERVGLFVEVTARVELLSVVMRQRLEILKALAADAKILLLDEPTAVLAPREVAELQRAIRNFVSGGGAVVLITHKLNEVFAMADRVTVLRHGKVALDGSVSDESRETLSVAMIGHHEEPAKAKVGAQENAARAQVFVRAENLTLRRHDPRSTTYDPKATIHNQAAIVSASFECRAGEITGIVAIEGNGQRELMRAMAGVDAIERTGVLEVAAPVAFIPEDRLGEALIPSFTLAENVLLSTLGEDRWIDWPSVKRETAELLTAFDVRSRGVSDTAAVLSGGNQQKLVFGRAMLRGPKVLIAEQPTRGLDLQATAEIHQRLRDAASNGMAVVLHSADMDEVIAIADRLWVVANGGVTEMSPEASREAIGDAMLGTLNVER